MIEGLSLGNDPLLVDYTAQCRDRKATLTRQVAKILDRLGTSPEHWQARLEKLRQGSRFGRFFAAKRERLRAVAERLGVRRVPVRGQANRHEIRDS